MFSKAVAYREATWRRHIPGIAWGSQEGAGMVLIQRVPCMQSLFMLP